MDTSSHAAIGLTTPEFTLKEHWLEHALTGIECVGVLMQEHGKLTAASLELPAQFVTLLNQLLDQKCDFEVPFQTTQMTNRVTASAQPHLQDGDNYLLIKLNVFTEMGRRASMPFGGVVYEDPFWAAIAAVELGYRNSRLAVPRAKGGEGLWEQIPQVIQLISVQSYHPEVILDSCLHPVPSDSEARFSLITSDAFRLSLLREKARCVIPSKTGGAIYQLYSPQS